MYTQSNYPLCIINTTRKLLSPILVCFPKGLHPRLVAEGFDIAKAKALEVLEEVKVTKIIDRDILVNVARTSLRTKVNADLADHLTEVG